MRLGTFAVALFFLAACGNRPAPTMSRGDELLNGGDPLAKLFETARDKAARIVDAVTTIAPEDFPAGAPHAAELARLYNARRGELRADILGTPRYTWVKRNANGACGATSAEPLAPISLAYDDCRGAILTETDAAIHLVGESAHHVGIGPDADAARFAIAVRQGWKRHLGSLDGQLAREILFEEGRHLSAEILRELDDSDIAGIGQLLLPDELLWLMGARSALSGRLVVASVEWTDELSPSPDGGTSCARYELERARLILSYTGCDGSVRNRLQAARVVLRAAIPSASPRIASAIVAAWLQHRGGERHVSAPELRWEHEVIP